MFRCLNRSIAQAKQHRNVVNVLASASGRSFTSNSISAGRKATRTRRLIQTGVVAVLGSAVVVYTHLQKDPIYNDASLPRSPTLENAKKATKSASQSLKLPDVSSENLTAIVWGSNKSGLLSPELPDDQVFRIPTSVKWLHGVALRDLALHERHAICVDARGDVYLWGMGQSEDKENESLRGATLLLRGQDIVSIQTTKTRVVALSSSGKIYTLPTKSSEQTPNPPSQSLWNPLNWFHNNSRKDLDSSVVELQTDGKLGRGEKFISISTGLHHSLALTSRGRTFVHPMSMDANAYGQLGIQRILISESSPGLQDRQNMDLVPKALADPFGRATAYARPNAESPASSIQAPASTRSTTAEAENSNSSFCDTLYEVPSLRGVKVAQAVAGARSSYVRTSDEGRVLAWGANEFGQLGLGSGVTVDTITIPTEVVFTRSASRGSRSRCVDINTGGDVTFFTVERRENTSSPTTDLLACGMGQWGSLGNGTYSSAQGNPLRIKAVSGLMEYSEKTRDLQPIVPYALSASSATTGHVILTLDTLERAGIEGGGRDVLVWGCGHDYQLGTGRRGSLATPTSLDLLNSHSNVPSTGLVIAGDPKKSKVEYTGGAGSSDRLMLSKRSAEVVRDMQGKDVRGLRGRNVEQCAVAGHGTSIIYWRICKD